MRTKILATTFFAAILLINLNISANPIGERAIVGNWQTIDDETNEARSIVRIFRSSDGLYYGRIVELLNREPGDEDPECENCTGKYAHYATSDGKVIGTIFLRGLEFNPDRQRWARGTIFDPEKGREYRSEVWLEDNVLKVRGIHWSGISRTQEWHPVK